MESIRFTLLIEVHKETQHSTISDEDGNILDVEEFEGTPEIVYETYAVNPDGQFLINPEKFLSKTGMIYKPGKEPKIKSRECHAEELNQINDIGSIEFCKKHNDIELEQLLKERKRFQKLITEFPQIDNLQAALSSLEEVVLKFENWYASNNLEFPLTKFEKKAK